MAKYTGFGTILRREDTPASGTFTAIGQIINITPPQYSRDAIDVTDQDSADGYKESIGGLCDAGNISIELNYDPAMHNSLLDDLDTAAAIKYELELPTTPAKTATLFAVLTGFAASTPFDGKATATLEWKVSGKPVWA